jgi:hypothetical protein
LLSLLFCPSQEKVRSTIHLIGKKALVGYALLMHARVAVPTPVYPFSDSFKRKFGIAPIQISMTP